MIRAIWANSLEQFDAFAHTFAGMVTKSKDPTKSTGIGFIAIQQKRAAPRKSPKNHGARRSKSERDNASIQQTFFKGMAVAALFCIVHGTPQRFEEPGETETAP
jgi:hypothetical protein|tara:strand:+ start:657 stop:968 length:312 start_codon:yes stop_codon:yes gene_type:complete